MGFRCRFGGPVENPTVQADRTGVLVPIFDALAEHRPTEPHELLVQPDLESGERLGIPSFRSFLDEGREGPERLDGPFGEPRKGTNGAARLT